MDALILKIESGFYIRSDEYYNLYADCEQRAENGNDEFSFVDPFNANNQEGD